MSKRSVNLLRNAMGKPMDINVQSLTVNGATRSPHLCPTAKTELAASTALSANTWYYNTHTGGADRAYTLPAAADSKKGDMIIVEYHGVIADSQTHKYGTSGEFFTAQSSAFRPKGDTGSAVGLIYTHSAANGSSHDFLNLIGATNAGPGIGSKVCFWFNGSAWLAEAYLTSSGTAAAANASVFATS